MHRLIFTIRLVISLLFFTLGTPLCMAQRTIRVPADVSTIQGAIDQAKTGDTVEVSPGLYNENLDFKGKGITVTTGAKSFGDAASTVINGTQDGPVVVFQTGEAASSILNGFTIQNGHASVASGARGGGIFVNNASPTITNNVISKNYGCGVFVVNLASPLIQGNDIKQSLYPPSLKNDVLCQSPSDGTVSGVGLFLGHAGDVQVIGNLIEDNATDPIGDTTDPTGAGVVVNFGQSLLLQNNIIRNNHNYGNPGFDEAGEHPVRKLVLLNNLFYGNTPRSRFYPTQIFISGLYGPFSGSSATVTEINNTIYGRGQELLYSFGPSTIANNVFVNDIVYPATDPLWAGLSCDSFVQASPIDIRNNDIFNAGVGHVGGCTLGPGNLSLNPAFRDPAAGDFHEQINSPLIAAGDIAAPLIPAIDLDAKARTVCNTIDMGAYELRPHPPIALSSSANPTPGGSTLTFTAKLTGNCKVPTGTVTFLDGGKVFGTAVINTSGIATLTTSFLVVGQHNITATYPGDFNFEDSTSDILVQTITGDPTLTSLIVSPNPASAFSPITLTGLVTSDYGTPTGLVVFTAGGQTLATTALDANGRATATVSTLGAGTYTITANYTADTRFQPSSSASVQEVVIGADTSTALTGSPNPAAVTQVVTFTVNVRALQAGTNIPTGTVTLLDGSAVIGTALLSATGSAVFNISTLNFGVHNVSARYGGSANFNPSSATLNEAVTAIGTALALTASPNPANTGQAVTLTARATAALAGMVPFGVITFRDGMTVLGTAPLSETGIATFTNSTLAVGSHPLQAILAANPTFAGSASAVVDEVIQAYDFALTTPLNSLSIPSGDWLVTTVTITPVGGFKGTVALSCANTADHTQCEFRDGSTISLADGPKTLKLTVNTSDVYGYGKKISQSAPPSRGSASGGGVLTALLLPVLGLLGLAGRKRLKVGGLWKTGLVLSFAGILLGLQACSGKLPAKAVPGNYSIMITGTTSDGSQLQHAISLHLSITP